MTDTTTTTTTTTPPPAWYQGVEGVDSEVIGHIQNRGLDKLTPVQAAISAVKAHREAEKFVGVPANRLIRLPEDPNNADAMKDVYQRLGKPSDAKEYDLSTVKRGDKPLDDKMQEFIRNTAFNTNLSRAGATRLAEEMSKFLDASEGETKAQRDAALVLEKTELKKNWGANEVANMLVAQNAAKALGVSAEHLAALENTIGYAKVMEMFRQIGTKIGEDKFVTVPGAPSNIMTREGATARKKELMADASWRDRYLNGGAPENREMLALNTIISAPAT